MFNPDTWAAYVLGDEVFVKRTTSDRTKTYPDFGCSFETFTNNDFLEIETLGPIAKIAPGQTVEHIEHWSLYRNLVLKDWNDEELDHVLLPLVQSVGSGR
jgi:hypothetical protein